MTPTLIRKPAKERTDTNRAVEETLVIDSRAGLTPSQIVERKLIGLLRGTTLPVSHLLSAAKGRY